MTRSVRESGLPTPKERRRLREAADLTHADVADAVGVTPATVRSWETGRTHPRGRKREAYAKLLARLASPPTPVAPPAPAAATLDPLSDPPPATARGDAAAPLPTTAAVANARPRRAAKADQRPRSTADPRRGAKADRSPSATAAPAPTPDAAPNRAPEAGTTPLPDPGSGAPVGPVVGGFAAVAAFTAPSPAASDVPPKASGPVLTEDQTASRAAESGPRAAAPAQTPALGGLAAVAAFAARAAAEARPDAVTADPEHAPAPRPEPAGEATPEAAFDLLYTHAAGALTRQAYLLTGRAALALESVEHAFHQAWARWPEVATDPDPVGWVRAATHEHALSPWHQLRRRHRQPDEPPVALADRILLDAMLALPPAHRRTVLLYDGVGLDLPDTAAETEATTPTAGGRLVHAHEELAEVLPELVDAPPARQSALLRGRLGSLRPPVPLQPRPAAEVRTACEQRTRGWTRAALGLTAVIAVATAYTTATAPTGFVPPESPGASVSGVPPLSGPQHLTEHGRHLHDKLRADPAAGPARIHPRVE
ncbi:helix-turn-helix domain-containing protein [Streptomyces sp. NPDC091268]|uniref:helix-turn-helix domain-containing protein n=1 Tax=Streptomyces sp. NPDC091268 TaxID=3365979 RepID=UPI00382D9B5C